MIVAALLSAIHMLTLALGLAAIFARGRALAGPLDEGRWRRVLAADNTWGAAALLWILSGLGRLFVGGKDPSFYLRNGFFWIKIGLFALVFMLELVPMATFMGVRSARSRGAALPVVRVVAIRRINAIEFGLVITIVFVAAFMARGAWLF